MFTEEYFSKWFNIIPEHDARTLWNDGDRSFLVLNIEDGTDRYADCFENFEEIKRSFPDALFGLDKAKQQWKFQKEGDYFYMKILYYIGFVLLSFITLGAIDIDIKFSNGQHLIRTGWLGFILSR